MNLNNILKIAKEIDTLMGYVKTKMMEPSKLGNCGNNEDIRKKNAEILNSLEEKADDFENFLESCYEENERLTVQKTEQLRSFDHFKNDAKTTFQKLNKILLDEYGMSLSSSDIDDTEKSDSTASVEKTEEKFPERKEPVEDNYINLEPKKYSQNGCKFQPPEWALSNSNIIFTPGLFPKGSTFMTPVIRK